MILALIENNANKLNKTQCQAFLQIAINNYLFLTSDQVKATHPK